MFGDTSITHVSLSHTCTHSGPLFAYQLRTRTTTSPTPTSPPSTEPFCHAAQWRTHYYLRQGGYVFIGVCLFVCSLAQLSKKNCATDFHKIRWKLERWHMVHGKKILEYGGNPDHFTSGLGPSMRSIWRSTAIYSAWEDTCYLATV